MSIQKHSLLLSVGLFMGIASGMEGDVPEIREALALLLYGHNKCNKYIIEPKIQLKEEICALTREMREFAETSKNSPTHHQDMDSKTFQFCSTERGAEVLLEAQVAQSQLRTLSRNPLFAGKTPDEIYNITLLLDLDEKPALDQIATALGLEEYGNKKDLARHLKDTYTSLLQ